LEAQEDAKPEDLGVLENIGGIRTCAEANNLRKP
jgi:hypothetical protein